MTVMIAGAVYMRHIDLGMHLFFFCTKPTCSAAYAQLVVLTGIMKIKNVVLGWGGVVLLWSGDLAVRFLYFRGCDVNCDLGGTQFWNFNVFRGIFLWGPYCL